MTIDAFSYHCQAVHALVLLCCLFEQLETLFSLNGQERDEGKHEKQLKSVITGLTVQSEVWCVAAVQPYRLIFDHGTNKRTSLHGAGAHSFCSALTEQTCHGGFVCQAELPFVLVRQLGSALKRVTTGSCFK